MTKMRCHAKALTVRERGGAVSAKKTVVEKNAALGFGGSEASVLRILESLYNFSRQEAVTAKLLMEGGNTVARRENKAVIMDVLT